MSDRKLGLVRWRDAKTDPPKDERHVCTDDGELFFCLEKLVWRDDDGRIGSPSVWCDPSPPGDDTLTVEHLRTLVDFPYLRFAVPHLQTLLDAQRALCRALDAMEVKP